MKLRAYREREGMTLAQLGERIDPSEPLQPRTVQRYEDGTRIPDRETMRKIVAATGGEVTPNDFFDVSVEQASAA